MKFIFLFYKIGDHKNKLDFLKLHLYTILKVMLKLYKKIN